MGNYSIKFKNIFPSFLIVSLSTILGMTLFRWFGTIQYDVVHFKQEVWDFYLAIGISGITSFIFFKPKLKLLVFKEDDQKGRAIFNGVAWATMAIPIIISQQYLSTIFSKLTVVQNIDQVDENKSLFHRIKNYEVVPAFASITDQSTTGRRLNKQWSLSAYFLFPMTSGNGAKKIHEYKYWYGVKFKKNISYTLSKEEINKKTEAFYKQCQSELRWDKLKDVNYFERLADSFERDKFLEALERKIGYQALSIEILIPTRR